MEVNITIKGKEEEISAYLDTIPYSMDYEVRE